MPLQRQPRRCRDGELAAENIQPSCEHGRIGSQQRFHIPLYKIHQEAIKEEWHRKAITSAVYNGDADVAAHRSWRGRAVTPTFTIDGVEILGADEKALHCIR